MSYFHLIRYPAQAMLFSTFVIATSQYASAESLNQNRFIISAITSNSSASNTAGTL